MVEIQMDNRAVVRLDSAGSGIEFVARGFHACTVQ